MDCEKEPKITIITIVRNGESTIEETIKSVISQNYRNLEYIVVDGKSTDGTEKIIEKYLSYIDKYICESDKGIAEAFNKGVMAATGDWIGVVNCGDYLLDGALDKIVRELITLPSECKILRCNIYIERKNGKCKITPPTKVYYKYPHKYKPRHMGCYIERNTLKKYKYDEKYRIAMDVELLYRMHRDNVIEKYTNIVVGKFVLGGVSTYHTLRMAKETVEIASENGLKGYQLKMYAVFLYVWESVNWVRKRLYKRLGYIR
jgi:glycosyltransferase involved in cell wall biosynthesis